MYIIYLRMLKINLKLLLYNSFIRHYVFRCGFLDRICESNEQGKLKRET